jgi:hypothetical protein
MKTINLLLAIVFALTFSGCKKESANQQIIPIPNGDFELWDNMLNLNSWQTNSCATCDPPYETYIVQKVTDVSNGQFAAKFIYNNVYSSYAKNKFSISLHPTLLTGCIKSKIEIGDTATIHIDIYSGNNIVDIGYFYETSSNVNYRKVEIPISQKSITVDSVLTQIVGGKKQNTELYVDNLVLLRND